MLTAREIAFLVWSVAFMAWALTLPDVRRSCAQLLRTFLCTALVVPLTLAIAYVGCCVFLLHSAGLWGMGVLKDTLIWFFGALAAAASLATSTKDDAILRTLVGDGLKVWVLVEFITGSYTFSLPVELILTPVLALLALTFAFTQANDEYKPARAPINGILTILGLAILINAFLLALADGNKLGTLSTLWSLMLPVVLSVLFAPFVYGMVLYSTYQRLFIPLEVGVHKPLSLRRYARRRLFTSIGLRLDRVRAFIRKNAVHMTQIASNDEVDALISGRQPSSAS